MWMAIGLNYTHDDFNGRLILPNYLYVLPNTYWPGDNLDLNALDAVVQQGDILDVLQDTHSDHRFDDPLIRRILLEAYPYEVGLKFLQLDLPNEDDRNVRLIDLFNQFFHIDYQKELDLYCQECQREELFLRSHEIENLSVYDDRRQAIVSFLNFVYMLLQDQ
jgi:hypothetical protein